MLVLATYRLTRLIGWDVITRPIRVRLTRRSESPDRMLPGYRQTLWEFLNCPFCLGFWISLGIWAAWWVTPKWTVWLALPLALSAAVGLLARHLDSD